MYWSRTEMVVPLLAIGLLMASVYRAGGTGAGRAQASEAHPLTPPVREGRPLLVPLLRVEAPCGFSSSRRGVLGPGLGGCVRHRADQSDLASGSGREASRLRDPRGESSEGRPGAADELPALQSSSSREPSIRCAEPAQRKAHGECLSGDQARSPRGRGSECRLGRLREHAGDRPRSGRSAPRASRSARLPRVRRSRGASSAPRGTRGGTVRVARLRPRQHDKQVHGPEASLRSRGRLDYRRTRSTRTASMPMPIRPLPVAPTSSGSERAGSIRSSSKKRPGDSRTGASTYSTAYSLPSRVTMSSGTASSSTSARFPF